MITLLEFTLAQHIRSCQQTVATEERSPHRSGRPTGTKVDQVGKRVHGKKFCQSQSTCNA